MNRRLLVNPRNLPVLVTLGLFIVMFGLGSVAFTGFFSVQNFLNLFIDNAYLLILAVGMTFVIISGGIDLSVGSMLALATMISSSLLEKSHMSPLFVIPIVLADRHGAGPLHGLPDPDLRPSALHHHPGRPVPGAGPVLRREHRHDRDHQRVLAGRGARRRSRSSATTSSRRAR